MAHSVCQDIQGILPPQINGKQTGFLTITVGDILFHSKTFKNVHIFISWWGEKEPTLMSVAKRRARYEIRTSIQQFEKYLKDCECLKIKIIDKDDSENIGWVTLLDLWLMLYYCPYKSYFPIVNSHGKCIGELHIEFNVRFSEKKVPTTFRNQNEVSSVCDISMSNRNSISQEENEREILKIKGDFSYPKQRRPNTCSLRDMSKSKSSSERYTDSGFETFLSDAGTQRVNAQKDTEDEVNIMDYILGKNMSIVEEKNTVNFLKHWPALESVLATISNNSEETKNSDLVKSDNESASEKNSFKHQTDISSGIYSLPSMGFHVYLKIISIELTSLDAYEMYKSSISTFPASGATYFIVYRFPTSTQNESKVKPWKEPLQGVRMSSKKQVGSVVFFNQSSIHKLSTNHKAMEEQLATNFIFRIHCRHLNQRVPSLIGEAQVLLEDLLPDNVQASQLRKIPILTTHSYHHKCKGMLVLRVKWVSIAKNLDCDTKSLSQKTNEILMDMTRSNVCLKSSMEKKELSQSVKNPEKEKSLENKLMPSLKALLLHVIICVPEVYYCLTKTGSVDVSKKASFNMYLVCRAFWNKGVSPRSQVYWSSNNPKLEFSEVEPLLLTSNFVDMCQNNYMVIELWNKKVKNDEDTLLGIAKVSVHQFYLAYKDPTVLEELMKLKYPVISMDGSVRLFSPTDPSNIRGWLRVLLAIGTQEQVYFLRKSHFTGLHSLSEITEKSRKQSSHDSLQNAVGINDEAGIEKHGLDIGIPTLEKNMQIDRLMGFTPFPKESSLENSECYVEYLLPLPNDQELKKTQVKPVSSIVKFFSPPVCVECPKNITGEITFYVWCRYYESNTPPRDRLVARTKLPLSRLFSRENESLNKGWTQNFSLPLTAIEEPTHDYNHCSGFLMLKIFDKAEDKSKTLTENVSFQTTGGPEKALDLKYNLNEKKSQECQTDASLGDIDIRPVFEYLREPVSSQVESLTEYHTPDENELLVDHRFMSTKEKEPIELNNIQESSVDSHPMSDNLNEGFCESPTSHICDKKSVTDLFKVHVEIHQAVHLKSETIIFGAYITFWSYNNEQLWITPSIYNGSNPRWNWHCDTYLSGELLMNSSKKLVLQVWNKRDARNEPDPVKDLSLGFASIDLNVLVYGMPQISGWFNIFNSGQQCIGQIKVNVTPMEDLSKFREIAKKFSFPESLKLKEPYNSALIKCIRQQSNAELSSKPTVFQEIKSHTLELGAENDVFIDLKKKILEEQCHISSVEENSSPETASQILKSKIEELEEMMKKLKGKFGVTKDQQFLQDATVDVDIPKLHRSNTYGKSLDLASPSEASISSNNSRKFSSVNPSTDLKILEKYVSELVHGISIQNSDNTVCISPGLEELFLQFGNYEFELVDQETRSEVCQNEQNPDLDLEKVENQRVNQKEISELVQDVGIDEFNESCKDIHKSGSSIALTSSSNSSSSINENGNNSNFGSEGQLREATEEEQSVDCVKGMEASMGEAEVNAQLEVLDLPRLAPEGGNPREDETIKAQPQNISPKQNQTQDDDCSRNDSIVRVCNRLYDNEEIQRIAKIFSSTFPKT